MITRQTFVVSRLLLLLVAATTISTAQVGGLPGAFSRLGFGARGAGMGNAMTAVITGDIVGYYNPALLSFAESRSASASFGILSLDRRLNFVSYTQALPPNAGISAGIVNSGVSKIDGRDIDGEQTGDMKTSENEIFLSFANRMKSGFSIGVTLKLLYYQLYTDVSSSTVGFDLGVLIPVGSSMTLGATVRDINSKYRWDTSPIYGQQGSTTSDEFPLLFTIGAAYKLPDSIGLVSAELEATNKKTFTGRMGVEVPIIPEVTVRGGLDRVDLKESGNGIRPTIGFSLRRNLDTWTPALHYAFVIEPFAPAPMHLISLSANF
jgi:hypothetical protein